MLMLMHPFQFGSLNLHNNQVFFYLGSNIPIWVENVSFCWCKIGHCTNAQQQKKQRTEEDPWSHRMELKDEDHGDLDYVNPSSFFFMLKNLLYIYIYIYWEIFYIFIF